MLCLEGDISLLYKRCQTGALPEVEVVEKRFKFFDTDALITID